MKSPWTIRRHVRELRQLIDNPATDAATSRIAYEVECALYWVLGRGGSESRAKSAIEAAETLRRELDIESQQQQKRPA